MDSAIFQFSEEELNVGGATGGGGSGGSGDSSSGLSPRPSITLPTSDTPATNIQPTMRQFKRPSSLDISSLTPTPESILRDSTNKKTLDGTVNGGEGGSVFQSTPNSPSTSVKQKEGEQQQQKQRVQKKKKRRTATNSYSDSTFAEKYKMTDELLGTGAHGVVKTCRDRVTKQEYAVKIISKARHPNRNRVFKEIDIYYHCRGCENILSIVDFLEDDESFYLVFQKMNGGPLLNHIMKRGRLTEREASLIVGEVANGLHFLHSKGMSHRDLKPENILVERVDSIVPIKLCDFDLGSAMRFNSKKTTPISTPALSTPVGSVEFMAPEVVDLWISSEGSLQMYDKRCDLWSLGVIVYIMLSGFPPFYGTCGHTCGWSKGEECDKCQSLLFERIQDGQFDFPAKEWENVSEDAKDLIKRLLVRDASLRLTAAEVLEHPWVKNGHLLDDHPLNTPRLLQRHDSIRRLETFTKDALSITKMIEKREQMHRSRASSADSSTSGSSSTGRPSTRRRRHIQTGRMQRGKEMAIHGHHVRKNHEEDEALSDEGADINESDSSVTRILKRRKKKRQVVVQQQQKNKSTLTQREEDDLALGADHESFDKVRRRLSSATMTSGDEEENGCGGEELFGCSFKTVIYKPPRVHPVFDDIPAPTPPPKPQFFLEPQVPPPPPPPPATSVVHLMSVPILPPPPPPPLFFMPPPAPPNLVHHRAHTDTDLYFRHHNVLLPAPVPPLWYTPPPVPPPALFLPLQPHLHHLQLRSSSADCRRTLSEAEKRVVARHPPARTGLVG